MGLRKKLIKSAKDDVQQTMNIFKVVGTPTIETWPDSLDWNQVKPIKGIDIKRAFNNDALVDFLQRFIILNPKNRINISNALIHEYLNVN